MRSCAELKPDVFVDIGANLGLYTCIVMKNRLAPRAILFEPDRRNRVHLRANLLINNLLDANIAIHDVALGAAPGKFRLVPGPERDIGLSQIVEDAPPAAGYEVEVVRFDDIVALKDRKLAVKIDIERYERKALAGMARTLRDNRGIVQIEVLEAREETVGLMAAAGFKVTTNSGGIGENGSRDVSVYAGFVPAIQVLICNQTTPTAAPIRRRSLRPSRRC